MGPVQDEVQSELNKLKAELHIVRSNVKRLENENLELKFEKSKNIINKHQIEDELRKKIEIEMKQSRIIENQKKYFKINSLPDKNKSFRLSADGKNNVLNMLSAGSCSEKQESNLSFSLQNVSVNECNKISPNFILLKTLDWSEVECEHNIDQLQFFKDYFFDDFFALDFNKFIPVMERSIKSDEKLFIRLFSLFCCKKEIFTKFSCEIFQNFQLLHTKIEILFNTPPEWCQEILDSDLKNFINKNKSLLGPFVYNFAKKCPFSLHKIFTKQDFDNAIRNKNVINHQIIDEICKNKIQGYVDETNLHLLTNDQLQYLYPSKYFDFF